VTSSTLRDPFGNILTNGSSASVVAGLGTVTNSVLEVMGGVLTFGLKTSVIAGQSLLSVQIGAASATTNVYFRGVSLLSVSSSSPTVSRGQSGLLIRAVMNNTSAQTLQNAVVALSLPPAYYLGTGPVYTNIPPQTVMTSYFQVTVATDAPLGAQAFSLGLSGFLGGNPVSYTNPSLTGFFAVQEPGRLEIEALIVPNQAVIGYLLPMIVRVKNAGEATVNNVHPTNLLISSTNAVVLFDPSLYSPGPVTLTAGQSVDFLYGFTTSGNQPQVFFTAMASGMEANTGNTVFSRVSNSYSTEIVSLSEVSLRIVQDLLAPVTVVRGQTGVPISSYSMLNPLGGASNDIIQVTRIVFSIESEDGNPVVPSSVLGRMRIVSSAGVHADLMVLPSSGNLVTVDLTNRINLAPGTNTSFVLYADIAPGAKEGGFRFNITDGASISAHLLNFTNAVVQDYIDSSGSPISDLRSSIIVVKDDSFGKSLGSYPNPFDPSKESATIEFWLENDSVVDVRIYTINGYLVRVLADGQRRTAGIVSERWDGKNGTGDTVRNGVYFAVITTGTGPDRKTGVVKVMVLQ
jgi:hypothetical protein